MEQMEVNERWQAAMGKYFEETDGLRPDEGFLKLEQVFTFPERRLARAANVLNFIYIGVFNYGDDFHFLALI